MFPPIQSCLKHLKDLSRKNLSFVSIEWFHSLIQHAADGFGDALLIVVKRDNDTHIHSTKSPRAQFQKRFSQRIWSRSLSLRASDLSACFS